MQTPASILVETCDNFLINLDCLGRLSSENQSKALLLTHMRGHIANMKDVMRICKQSRLLLIEDCAHTNGRKMGWSIHRALWTAWLFQLSDL